MISSTFTTGCVRSTPELPPLLEGGALTGIVVERDPVLAEFVGRAGVLVRVLQTGISATTDERGFFLLTRLPLADAWVMFERRDGDNRVVSSRLLGPIVVELDAEAIDLGEVRLGGVGSVFGEVMQIESPEAPEAPAAGALVIAARTAFKAVVETDGSFRLPGLPDGQFDVVAFQAGFDSAHAPQTEVLSAEETQISRLVLERAESTVPLRIAGEVSLSGSEDASGVDVQLLSEVDPSAVLESAMTDADGAFSFSVLPGLYLVRFQKEGFTSVELSGIGVLREGIVLGLRPVHLVSVQLEDLDGDQIPDDVDPDRDNDGCPNETDAFQDDVFGCLDTDRDGVADRLDLDDDDDGLDDLEELSHGRDGWLTDPLDSDTDGDGWSDGQDPCPLVRDIDSTGKACRTLCSSDQRVLYHMCVPCPVWTTNQAGDDTSGDNTTCEPIRCGRDQHVEDHACVACPAGTVNAPGNEVSGLDTKCEDLLCGSDQRVEKHSCVDCPAGTTNQPGDSASGTDTTCDDVCMRALGISCADFEEGYLKASNGGFTSLVDNGLGDGFGFSLALFGDTLAVGAPNEDSQPSNGPANFGNPDSGAVYVFVRRDGEWTEQALLKASDASPTDNFGWSVALSDDTLAVGTAISEERQESGRVYVFGRSDGEWVEQAIIEASDPHPNDYFGRSLALADDTLAIGAYLHDWGRPEPFEADSGAVYVFARVGGRWVQQALLKASTEGREYWFGRSVALSGNTLAVGSPQEDFGQGGSGPILDNGGVYVFVRAGGEWTQQARLEASNSGNGDRFGWSVALCGDTLAVGAHLEDGEGRGTDGLGEGSNGAPDSGAAYVFVRRQGAWTQEAYIKASNVGPEDYFGASLALFEDRLAVGALFEDNGGRGVNSRDLENSRAEDSGGVYLFTRTQEGWVQDAHIKASNTGTGDLFGASVALFGETLAVGASSEDSDATMVGGDQENDDAGGTGAVYVRRIAP